MNREEIRKKWKNRELAEVSQNKLARQEETQNPNLYKQTFGLGNINLRNRPVVKNSDGSISTVRSMSFYDDDEKKEILVPTVVGGKIVSDREAIDNYYKTGQYLGKFDTPEEATDYALKLHDAQDKYYNKPNVQQTSINSSSWERVQNRVNQSTSTWDRVMSTANKIANTFNQRTQPYSRTNISVDIDKYKQMRNPETTQNNLLNNNTNVLNVLDRTITKNNLQNFQKPTEIVETPKEIFKIPKVDKLPEKTLNNEELENLSQMNDFERNEFLNKTNKNKKEVEKINNQVKNYIVSKNAQENAQKINSDISNGDYGSAIYHILSGLPREALNATTKTVGAVSSLRPGQENLANVTKAMTKGYQETTSQIENPYIRTGAQVTGAVGNMIPGIASNIVAPGSGIYVNAVNVGTSEYLSTLNEEQTNKLQAILTGVAKGAVSKKVEELAGGNIFSEGSFDDVALNGIAKIKSDAVRWLASKGYEVGGEVAEENIENLIGYAIDSIINNEDITAEQLASDFKETSKDTALTTLFLDALGLGGNTYRETTQGTINNIIEESNLSDAQKEILTETAEKNGLSKKEVEYLIDNTKNGKYEQNQATTTQNNEILNQEQQTIQQEGKQAQNQLSQETGNIEQKVLNLRQSIDNYNNSRAEGQEIFDINNEETRKEIESIQKIAQDRNINIIFDENRFKNSNENAFYEYDKDNNVANIVLNPNSTSKKYVQNLVIHEMTHSFEGSKEYNNLSKAILDYAKSKGEYDSAFKDLMNTYSKVYSGENLNEIVEKEAVANILGEKLGDKEFVDSLVNNQYVERSTIQKIIDFIKNQINRFKGYKDQEAYWNHVKTLFEDAYNKSEVSKEGLKQSVETNNLTDNQGNEDVDTRIKKTMTMKQAKKMLDMAFIDNGIYDWYDGKYKNADEWLQGEGVDEVETYIDNTFSTMDIVNEIYKFDESYGDEYFTSDILQAYLDGTLEGHEVDNKAKRLDTSIDTGYKDNRFYAPQEFKTEKELYDFANQRVTEKNKQAVYRARGELIINAHNPNYAESIGLTQEELNKKIKSWANYPKKTMELSNSLNEGVARQNQWTGLENSSIVNTIAISNEELDKMVKKVEGDSNGWQRKYITSTMLALDTHIDYSNLTFKFEQQRELAKRSAVGEYQRETDTILIGNGYQNTVAHEIGHYVDSRWARDLGIKQDYLSDSYVKTDNLNEQQKQFVENFQKFIKSIKEDSYLGSKYGGRDSEYWQHNTEVFARFVGKFVEWTKNEATNNRYGYEDKYYKDNFTESQYKEFVKLLQEKSMLDTSKQNNVQYSQDTTGEWNNFIEKYFKNEGTGTAIKDMKKLPEMSITKYQEVLDNAKYIPQEDKQNLLSYLDDIKKNKSSLDDFKKIVNDLNNTYKQDNVLDTTETYSTGRKEKYQKYLKSKTDYDNSALKNALDIIPANNQGRRTKEQWLNVAKQIGTEIANKSNQEIEEIAFRTWQDERPSSKESLNRQGNKFVGFNSDEWINAIYDSVNEQRQYSVDTEQQAEQPVEQTVNYTEKEPVLKYNISDTIETKNKKQTDERVAEILTEPLTQQKPENRKWAILKANLFDKGIVFEDLSKKTKNRELESKWDYSLTSESRAQNAIGNTRYEFEDGKKKQVSKALLDIKEEVGNKTADFQNYMYHLLNIDRMSLQDRFGIENKPVFRKQYRCKLFKKQSSRI